MRGPAISHLQLLLQCISAAGVLGSFLVIPGAVIAAFQQAHVLYCCIVHRASKPMQTGLYAQAMLVMSIAIRCAHFCCPYAVSSRSNLRCMHGGSERGLCLGIPAPPSKYLIWRSFLSDAADQAAADNARCCARRAQHAWLDFSSQSRSSACGTRLPA